MIREDAAPNVMQGAEEGPVSHDLTSFIGALFTANDKVLIRPIETWTDAKSGKKASRVVYKAIEHIDAGGLATLFTLWQSLLDTAHQEHANLYFGVCPRFGGNEQFDLAWQIRTVRALWMDIDDCTVEEALQRCEKIDLSRPSIVVHSGNGVHLYWLLTEPYLIDDVEPPPPVYREFIDQGAGRKKKVRLYTLAGEKKVYNLPSVSAKGEHIQTIIAGMAARVGGDHTHDLARILRLPCTLNRKDERNGRDPVPCVLVECDPQRRYSIANFERFTEVAPKKVEGKHVAKVRLPDGKKLTVKGLNTLSDFIKRCSVASVGGRSEADFALCAWAIREGLDQVEVWKQVEDVGKFAEAGRRCFNLTWKNAEDAVRSEVHKNACRRAGLRDDDAANKQQVNGDGLVLVPMILIKGQAAQGEILLTKGRAILQTNPTFI
jgi:hypothetical protein